MDIYAVRNRGGRMFAFEIENVYIGKTKAATLLGSVHGVADIRVRKLFSSNPDTHVEFTYMGRPFMVWEPYGDSSRYWIGPRDETQEIDVCALESVFQQYRPSLVIKVIGDLISFKFLAHLKRWFKSKHQK